MTTMNSSGCERHPPRWIGGGTEDILVPTTQAPGRQEAQAAATTAAQEAAPVPMANSAEIVPPEAPAPVNAAPQPPTKTDPPAPATDREALRNIISGELPQRPHHVEPLATPAAETQLPPAEVAETVIAQRQLAPATNILTTDSQPAVPPEELRSMPAPQMRADVAGGAVQRAERALALAIGATTQEHSHRTADHNKNSESLAWWLRVQYVHASAVPRPYA